MAEQKYNYFSIFHQATATPKFESFFSGFGVGTAFNERIGQSIFVRRIDINIRIDPLRSEDPSYCRIGVYYNNQCAGSLPAAADVWLPRNILNPASYYYYNAFRNPRHARRIRLPRDYLHAMAPISTPEVGQPIAVAGAVNLRWAVYPRRKVMFNGEDVGIGALAGFDAGFFIVADDADCCTVTTNFVVHFTDS